MKFLFSLSDCLWLKYLMQFCGESLNMENLSSVFICNLFFQICQLFICDTKNFGKINKIIWLFKRKTVLTQFLAKFVCIELPYAFFKFNNIDNFLFLYIIKYKYIIILFPEYILIIVSSEKKLNFFELHIELPTVFSYEFLTLRAVFTIF